MKPSGSAIASPFLLAAPGSFLAPADRSYHDSVVLLRKARKRRAILALSGQLYASSRSAWAIICLVVSAATTLASYARDASMAFNCSITGLMFGSGT